MAKEFGIVADFRKALQTAAKTRNPDTGYRNRRRAIQAWSVMTAAAKRQAEPIANEYFSVWRRAIEEQ